MRRCRSRLHVGRCAAPCVLGHPWHEPTLGLDPGRPHASLTWVCGEVGDARGEMGRGPGAPQRASLTRFILRLLPVAPC